MSLTRIEFVSQIDETDRSKVWAIPLEDGIDAIQYPLVRDDVEFEWEIDPTAIESPDKRTVQNGCEDLRTPQFLICPSAQVEPRMHITDQGAMQVRRTGIDQIKVDLPRKR